MKKLLLVIFAAACGLAGAEAPAEAAGPYLTLVSSAVFAGSSGGQPAAITSDASNNIFVAGYNYGTGNDDFYTIKYDKDLNISAFATHDYGGGDKGQAVAVDASGNVFVAGERNITSDDFCTVKYDNNLNFISSAAFDGGSTDDAYGVAVDASGNVFVAGASVLGGKYYMLTLKYDSQLNLVSSAAYNNGGLAYAKGVAVDAAGNVFAAGYRIYGENYEFFTIKYDNDLNTLGSAVISSKYYDASEPGYAGSNLQGIALNSAGDVYVSGLLYSAGYNRSLFAARYTNSLQLVSSGTYVFGNYPYNTGIAVDATGHVLLSGLFTGNMLTVALDADLHFISSATYDTGGSDYANAVTVDRTGAVVVAGYYEPAPNHFLTMKYMLEYSSSAPADNGATVGIIPASGDIFVTVPSGAFSGGSSVAINSAAVPAGQGGVVLTNIGIQVTNSAGLQPLRPLEITAHYRNADIAGLDERRLSLVRYDGGSWVVVPTVVYASENRLVGTVQHLSLFAVAQLAPSATLAEVRAYPMPFVPANGLLTIDRLTGEAEIKIFTIAGELVKKLDYTAATGIAKWDGTNNAGKGVASGVYIALIKSPAGTKKLKIALEK